MKRDEFVAMISEKMKIIRVEAGLTQDRMAEILGISKKTLVQVEKGRVIAGWPVVVTLCALFRESELLYSAFGGDQLEIVSILAFEHYERPRGKTLGGKVWWTDVETKNGFRLQQNILSGHYRILDKNNYRWCSSFKEIYIRKRLAEMAENLDVSSETFDSGEDLRNVKGRV